MIIEVPCGNMESVHAAKNGGADRIELCSALPLGGLSPSLAFLEHALKLGLDVFAIVRPREGDFVYSDDEFEIMLREIEIFKSSGANGIVSGILLNDGEIDVDRTGKLIELTRPLPFTFHRAFDLTNDPLRSLKVLIELNVDRLLTSGCAADAWSGREVIKNLVTESKNKITIMAGAGINIHNAPEIYSYTGVKEIHLSGRIKKQNIFGNKSSAFMGKEDEENFYFVTDEDIIREIRTKFG
jgi:copper homeostasis protein